MTQLYDWQGEVGRKWARLHALTDRSLAGLTQHLLERLERLPARAILDIGCGAGELSLALARLRPQAEVVGVDVSADLLAASKARGRPSKSGRASSAASCSAPLAAHDAASAHSTRGRKRGEANRDMAVSGGLDMRRWSEPQVTPSMTCEVMEAAAPSPTIRA